MPTKPKRKLADAARTAPDTISIGALRGIVDADPELRAISLDDIVKTYSVSKRSLLRYVAAGELRATRFGRKYVVTLAALRAFLASNRLSEKAEPAAAARRKHTR